MKSSVMIRRASVLALLPLFAAGCSNMDRQEKSTAVGATSGAVLGAVVGGPVGAAVGAGVGGYVGHEGTTPGASTASAGENSATVRSVQQSLNDRGYNAGPVDGVWGKNTEDALRQFQQANGLPQTGNLDSRTLAALGIEHSSASTASNAPSSSRTTTASNAPSSSNRTSSASSQPSTSQASNEPLPRETTNEPLPRQASNEPMPNQAGNESSSETGGSMASTSDHELVRSVQQALNDHGYNAGPVDGIWGPKTENGLRQFQQAKGLPQTDELDSRTLSALGVESSATTASNAPSGSRASRTPSSQQASNAR